jgi:signal transduction histidine kinase
VTPGDYVTLAVRDTGVGMDEATRRPFLQKPFTPQALTRKVRDVLDAPSTPKRRAGDV